MKTKFRTRHLFAIVTLFLFVASCKKANNDLGTIGVCPEVVSTNPNDLATGVMLNSPVLVKFNEAMNPATFTETSFIVKQGNNVVAGKISYADTSAVFTPASDLLPLSEYTIIMKAGVKDPAGNAMIDEYKSTFTTGKLIDIISPTIVDTDPDDKAVDIAITKIISVTFSELMDPASLLSNFVVTNTTAGGTVVDGAISYLENTAYFTPTSPLENKNDYTVTIKTGAKDLPGNALSANFAFSFKTIALADLPPSVTLTSPGNLELLVEPNVIISATFSENVNTTTVTSGSFLLTLNGVAVNGSVNATGSNATFTPSPVLLFDKTYEATITTAVKDLAGNNLVTAHTWTFKTKPEPIIPPALGTMANFGVFGGTAGMTNQGINTVINNGGIGTLAVPTKVTGFHDGISNAIYTETDLNVGLVKGGIFTAPPLPGDAASYDIAVKAHQDAEAAYLEISPVSKPGGIDPGAGELGGLTLTPGVYKAAGGSFAITNNDLTLDARGDQNAIFIFQAPTSLTVGIAGPLGARSVKLINGAEAKNVFWWVGTSATINGAGGGTMSGTIISMQGVTFSTADNTVQTVLNGRAISLVASITMVNTTINVQ
jgi:ice-binding like protein/Big-like domain-containing protein